MSFEFALSILMTYKYWMFLPIAVTIGGPILALVAGILTSLGYLHPLATYAMLLVCDVVPDTIYYYIGASMDRKKFVERYGKRIGLHHGSIDFIERLWRDHTVKSMMVSKWAYGLSGPLLMSAGLVNMPFKRYISYSFTITMAQYIVLYWLGFTYGSSYKLLVGSIHSMEYIVAGAIGLTIVGYFVFTRFMRRFFMREEEQAGA